MWADNVKFVKDIVDSKYAKIETAAADVRENQNQSNLYLQIALVWYAGGNPKLEITFVWSKYFD